MVRWLKNRWASTASQLEKPCGYTGRSPIRKKTTRATTGRNPFKSFFFISSKCTSFSLHPSIWNRLEKPKLDVEHWNDDDFKRKATPKTGEKRFPREREREREKILALFQGPSFSYIQILSFRVGYCRMGMKRSDQHPINRQSIFRKRDSTQNKWIKEEKTVQQSSGWMM